MSTHLSGGMSNKTTLPRNKEWHRLACQPQAVLDSSFIVKDTPTCKKCLDIEYRGTHCDICGKIEDGRRYISLTKVRCTQCSVKETLRNRFEIELSNSIYNRMRAAAAICRACSQYTSDVHQTRRMTLTQAGDAYILCSACSDKIINVINSHCHDILSNIIENNNYVRAMELGKMTDNKMNNSMQLEPMSEATILHHVLTYRSKEMVLPIVLSDSEVKFFKSIGAEIFTGVKEGSTVEYSYIMNTDSLFSAVEIYNKQIKNTGMSFSDYLISVFSGAKK